MAPPRSPSASAQLMSTSFSERPRPAPRTTTMNHSYSGNNYEYTPRFNKYDSGRAIREEHERLTYGPEGSRGEMETDILDDEDEEGEVSNLGDAVGSISRQAEDDSKAEPGSSSESEEDPEYLELMERQNIIDKYDNGPEGKDIDDWENPKFDLYQTTDRFGFVHKNATELTEAEQAARRRLERQLRREKKWLTMLSLWKSGTVVKKLVDRVWKGIPDKLRSVVWTRLLHIDRFKSEARDGDRLYGELLVRARLVSKDIKQIDLDINRTYRDHVAFRKRYDVKQQSLLNVLAAYSMYNTEEKNDIPFIYLTKWWFGCFLDRVPFDLALRIWDVFILEGDIILIAMALNIMKMHESMSLVIRYSSETIRKLHIETFMDFVQTEIAKDFRFPADEVMKSLREIVGKLRVDRKVQPSPQRPGDLPEIPTKAFGPILTRSLADIRNDIVEIQSRCSRANSLAARSPNPHRRSMGRPAASPTPQSTRFLDTTNHSEDGSARTVPSLSTPSSRSSTRPLPARPLPPIEEPRRDSAPSRERSSTDAHMANRKSTYDNVHVEQNGASIVTETRIFQSEDFVTHVSIGDYESPRRQTAPVFRAVPATTVTPQGYASAQRRRPSREVVGAGYTSPTKHSIV